MSPIWPDLSGLVPTKSRKSHAIHTSAVCSVMRLLCALRKRQKIVVPFPIGICAQIFSRRTGMNANLRRVAAN